MYLTIH